MKALLCCAVLIGLSLPAATDKPATYRKHLDHPALIQGYPCAADYAWFFADGRLNRCFLSRDIDIGEAHVPGGSVVELFADGSLSYVMLKRNTVIGEVECSGGGPLGPAEGSVTELYPSGKVKLCFLPADQTVQGVPCAAGGFWKAMAGHDQPVEFHENGKLKSCRLSRAFGNRKKYDQFRQPR